MNKVALEVAEKEVSGWLDLKKVNNSKRKSKKDQIETLVNAVCEGEVSINKDGTIIQTLKFAPISDTDSKEKIDPLKSLVYKSRLSGAQRAAAMKNGSDGDWMKVIFATASALTGEMKETFASLDTEDLGIVMAIASFFLPA